MIRKRIEYIDTLKGVGIILVMMSHMINCSYLTPLYGGFIPLFFVASGLTSSTIDITGNVLRKKAVRLLFPYFFYGTSIVLLYYIFSLDENVFQNFIGLLYARCRILKDSIGEQSISIGLLPREVAPLWFLPAMFMAYISLFLTKKWGGQITMVLITIIACISPFVWLWSLDTCYIHGLFILVGFRCKKILEKISFTQVMVLGIFYLLVFYLNKMPNISISAYGIWGGFSILFYLILGFIETAIVLYFCRFIDRFKISSILKYFGRKSMRLMCLHMGAYTFIDEYSALPNYFKIVLTLLIVVTIIYLIDMLISRFENKNIIIKYI